MFQQAVDVMLRMFVSENKRDWDEKLPALMCAYRATPQTGLTRNMMRFGRELEMTIDLMVGSPCVDHDGVFLYLIFYC